MKLGECQIRESQVRDQWTESHLEPDCQGFVLPSIKGAFTQAGAPGRPPMTADPLWARLYAALPLQVLSVMQTKDQFHPTEWERQALLKGFLLHYF
jgi:hypothetical protein